MTPCCGVTDCRDLLDDFVTDTIFASVVLHVSLHPNQRRIQMVTRSCARQRPCFHAADDLHNKLKQQTAEDSNKGLILGSGEKRVGQSIKLRSLEHLTARTCQWAEYS